MTFDSQDHIVRKSCAVGFQEKIDELSPYQAFAAKKWTAGEVSKETVSFAQVYLGEKLPGIEYSHVWQAARVSKANIPALEKCIPVLYPLLMAGKRPDVVFYLGELLRCAKDWDRFKLLHPELSHKQRHSLVQAWDSLGFDDGALEDLPDEVVLQLISHAAKLRKDYLASGYQPSKTVPDFDLRKYTAAPQKEAITPQQYRQLAKEWHEWTMCYTDEEVPEQLACFIPESLIVKSIKQFDGDIDAVYDILSAHQEVIYSTYDGVTILSDHPRLRKCCLETFLEASFYLCELDLPSCQTYGPLLALPMDAVEKLVSEGKILKREYTYEMDQDNQPHLVQKLKKVSL